MPLPSDAARVSLLAESSEDEHEISAPRRMANPLAHAPDAELDALVRALRSKKPSDRAKLEAEEREAARARVRVELMSHVHRLKRDGVVAFPAGFDADAKAAAEARREDDALFDRSVRASMTDATRTASDERPFDRNGRSTRTETVSSSSAASRDASDADADDDVDVFFSENLRDLDGSFERFRVSVDELANGPEPEALGRTRSSTRRAKTTSSPRRRNRASRSSRRWTTRSRRSKKISRRASTETFPETFPSRTTITTITTSTTDTYHPRPIRHTRTSRSMSRSMSRSAAATPRRGWRASTRA